jgi:hypothetical protein
MSDPLHSRLMHNNMMMAGPFANQLRLRTDITSKNINLNFTLSRIMVGTRAFLSQITIVLQIGFSWLHLQ